MCGLQCFVIYNALINDRLGICRLTTCEWINPLKINTKKNDKNTTKVLTDIYQGNQRFSKKSKVIIKVEYVQIIVIQCIILYNDSNRTICNVITLSLLTM